MPASSTEVVRYECPCRWLKQGANDKQLKSWLLQSLIFYHVGTTTMQHPIVSHNVFAIYIPKWNEPLARYAKMRVVHAPGMPGTFSRHRLQRKPLVSDPGMHHGTCVTHVSWSMSGSLTRGGRENVPGIPGACATLNFTYLVRGPWHPYFNNVFFDIWKIF